MLAAVIRRERYGQPTMPFGLSKCPSLPLAAGASRLISARQQRGHPENFNIAGSDASGIVRAVGAAVKNRASG